MRIYCNIACVVACVVSLLGCSGDTSTPEDVYVSLEPRKDFFGFIQPWGTASTVPKWRFDVALSAAGYEEYADLCTEHDPSCADVAPYDSSRTYLAVVDRDSCGESISVDSVERRDDGVDIRDFVFVKHTVLRCAACLTVVTAPKVTVYSWQGRARHVALQETYDFPSCN